MTARSFLVAIALAATGLAQAETLNPVDRGYVESSFSLFGTQIRHDPNVTTLKVHDFAFLGGVGSVVIHDNAYLLFDVPAGLPDAASARLLLGLDNPGPFVGIVRAWDVNSLPAAFSVAYVDSAEPAARDLVTDLQSGNQYGSAALPLGSALSVEVTLSPQGLTDLMAARGGVFGIGLSGGLGGGTLAVPATFGQAQLEVTLVPEPGTAALALAGLAALAAWRRRG